MLTITHAAAKKVWDLIQEAGDPSLSLRVSISGGGCSGFQYGFAFDENTQEDDTVITGAVSNEPNAPQIKVLIDPLSFQYLSEAEIDYAEEALSSRFIIRNPMAETTCGCGSSFSVADQE